MNDDKIIDNILRREGGDKYTNRASDRGGETKFGITQKTWQGYRAKLADNGLPAHVKDIEEGHARRFYREEHVNQRAWIKNAELKELVIDCSVNHGPGRTDKWLQEAAGVTVDGVVGPITKQAAITKAFTTRRNLLKRRFNFYAEIASDQLPCDPDLPNLRGWISRASEFI